MGLIIRKCTISEIENSPNISDFLTAYASESAIKGLPHPSAKAKTYKALEDIGAIQVIGAFVDNLIIGFIIILSNVLPHYDVQAAVSESFFVLKSYRKTGAGLKLLREAENYSKDSGACGLLISAPIGGDLAKVMPHIGYLETNRVFFRSFSNA